MHFVFVVPRPSVHGVQRGEMNGLCIYYELHTE